MNKKDESIKIDQVIDIILRHRWLIFIPLCMALMAGIYLTHTLPRTYISEALILVRPQEVPVDYVQSIVTSGINARINTISQQILSRTNLEKIIESLNLFKDEKYSSMRMEDKIINIRKNIHISLARMTVSKRQKSTGAFTISFKGENPSTVLKVTNELVSHFINENLKVREAQALGTSDFLEDELKNIRTQLEGVEETYKTYRKKYMGALPEQLETNLRILDRLQDQLLAKQQLLADSKSRLFALTNSDAGTGDDPISKLKYLKQKLSELKVKYTDEHPDVQRLKKMINNTEAAGNKSTDKKKGKSKIDFYAAQRSANVKKEIKKIRLDINKINKQIAVYQQHVENTPKREQELMSLQRDYQNIKDIYNSILKRKLEAEISVNMERKQKGEQFRLVDPPRLPVTPIAPDMRKLFMFTIAAGLGVGAALIFMLEFLDTSIRKIEDVESFLGVPLLCTVSTIHQKNRAKKIWLYRVLTVISTFITLLLLAYFAFLTIT